MSMMRDHLPSDLENNDRNCGLCGSYQRWFLHHVRHKGEYRTVCTNCVLKNNPGLFCPICLDFFDRPPPPSEKIMCVKCPSVAHPACIGPNRPCFECPPCSKPTSFSFFSPGRHTDGGGCNAAVAVEKADAKALVAAARVSAQLMAKAAVVARGVADMRVKEALAAKKRAREALEKLSSVMEKQKEKELKTGVVSPPENENGRRKLDCSSPVVQLGPKID